VAIIEPEVIADTAADGTCRIVDAASIVWALSGYRISAAGLPRGGCIRGDSE
jgi:hypothetical protein